MKYRKKPIVIEAERFVPPDDCDMFMSYPIDRNGTYPMIRIQTLEGEMVAFYGDWVITGIKGEQYPCKNDIFEATYEPVEDIVEVTP